MSSISDSIIAQAELSPGKQQCISVTSSALWEKQARACSQSRLLLSPRLKPTKAFARAFDRSNAHLLIRRWAKLVTPNCQISLLDLPSTPAADRDFFSNGIQYATKPSKPKTL